MIKIKKYKYYILPLVLIFVTLILNSIGAIDLNSLTGDNKDSVHFNLITVNSIFAGFLFTAITFFVGINTTKTIEVLERIDYMDKVYKNLNMGFIASLISIMLSLITIFILPTIVEISWIKEFIFIEYILLTIVPIIIIDSLIYTIIKFLIALKHLNFIISSIRRKAKLNAPSKDSVEETLKRIK